MKILDVQQNTDEWLEARKGKITGSKLKDLVVLRGTGRKIGFYELLADKLAIPEEEDARERGHRLEQEAIDRFKKETGKKVETDIGLCVSEADDSIAVSPDGLIKNKGKYTEAVEVKCLGSKYHLQAVIENQIPKDYYYQVLQYFVVNDDLKKLYFVFYDPRIPSKPYHVIEVERDDEEVERYKAYQLDVIEQINSYVEQFTF